MNKILALLIQKLLFIKNKAVSIYNQNFSTPMGAYVLLFFATAFFLWHGLTSHCDFTKNVGYSLFASIIAAAFIDIGNTHAKNNAEKRQFNIIKEELKYAFRNLRETAENLYDYYSDGNQSNLSFYQRIDFLVDPNLYSSKQFNPKETLLGFSYAIDRIRIESTRLLDRMYDNSSLAIITDEQRKQVRQINNRANRIHDLFKMGHSLSAMGVIRDKLLPCYYQFEPQEEAQFHEHFRLDIDVPEFMKHEMN